MSEKDDLINAQKQVIGILFEVVKRQQTNIDLDQEFYQLAISNADSPRIKEISQERKANSEIIGRLLKQLEI
jgi:hypothetical protein